MQQQHYIALTEQIIHQLEQGVRPWARDWKDNPRTCNARPLRHNGVPYQGVNVLSLWCASAARGFASSYWMTFKQAQELGANVRKGARSEKVFKVGTVTRADEKTGDEHSFSYLRVYSVFNAEEVEGLPAHFNPLSYEIAREENRIAAADDFVRRTGASVRHGTNQPCYRPRLDLIEIPTLDQFATPQGYYATLLHELTHWTGTPERIERPKGIKGTSEYAFEELVAELGAAFLCADLQITAEPRADHVQYLAHWVEALKENPRVLLRACGVAERAVTYLHTLQASVPMLARAA